MALKNYQSSNPPRIFLGHLEQNPKGHVSVITLRNGKKNLDEPKWKNRIKEFEKVRATNEVEEEEKEKRYLPPPPYKLLFHSHKGLKNPR